MTDESSSGVGPGRLQFSLRSLMLFTLGVALYVAFASLAVRNHGALLAALSDALGFYAIVCGLLLLASLGMMAINIGWSRSGRGWAVGLLVAGIAFGGVNVVVLAATLSWDEFVLFDDAYLISVVFVGPALMFASLAIAAACTKPGWFGVLGLAIWIASVGFAQLWIIAAASASV